MRHILLTGIATFALAGCASVPGEPMDEDEPRFGSSEGVHRVT